MDLVFLDANILFSAAWAARARMRRLWRLAPGQARLVTSDQAIGEARRNLPAAKHGDLDNLLRDVEQVTTPPQDRWRAVPGLTLPDPDLGILQAAIAARATHLLTGDRRHFGPYYGQTIRGVLILPPSDYPHPGAGTKTAVP